MSTRALLDPELHPIADQFAGFVVNAEALPMLRAQEAPLADAEALGVTRSEVTFAAEDGAAIRALLYRPHAAGSGGGYVHLHGGGYIVGRPEAADAANLRIAARLRAVVLSVAYRLAPEHPIPAPLHDAYAGLRWLHEHAGELGVDRSRIASGGESAGGGLAAALAILARERGEFAICHQHLTDPMLDDRTGTDTASVDPLVGEFVWTPESNRFGWSSYLGDARAEAPQVPARVDDVRGLPPTWLSTAALDLFRDENLVFAQRLMRAGVRTDLVVYPAACHGFPLLPDTALAQRYAEDHLRALATGLGVTFER